MIKILIIENRLLYIKSILNNIISKIEYSNIATYIATNFEEAVDIVSDNFIDLILIDLETSNNIQCFL